MAVIAERLIVIVPCLFGRTVIPEVCLYVVCVTGRATGSLKDTQKRIGHEAVNNMGNHTPCVRLPWILARSGREARCGIDEFVLHQE